MRAQILLALMMVCALPVGAAAQTAGPPSSPGAILYAKTCASCHGVRLEGQPNWDRVNSTGRLPAPPHDETGHTWEHSDAELIAMIKTGRAASAPADYVSDMPAFKDTLSDAEIDAILAFIKSQWSPGVRAYQAALNPGGTFDDVPGDWSFPPTCKPTRP